MDLQYLIRESFSGLRRATMSTLVSITIMSIALSALAFFLIATANLNRVGTELRSRLELEAFLDKSLNVAAAKQIEQQIRSLEGIESVQYISKADAAKILKSIMGVDDLFDLINTNPLPASFKIKLKPEYRITEFTEAISKSLRDIEGIDDVNYPKDILQALDEKTETFHSITLGIGIFSALAAILLVSNTIKLSIYAKRDLIKTMKLVGAKSSFIAAPFLIEGVVQGLVGGGLAVLFSKAMVYGIRKHLITGISADAFIYGIIISTGVVLGLIGSGLSIRFFLKEKISDM